MSGSVLVTGAGGFAGQQLVRELGDRAVTAEADVTAPDALAQAFGSTEVDAIAHLAAASSVAESWRQGERVWRVNTLGTVNVLDTARARQPKARVLVVSSGEVYGDTAGTPAREDRTLAPLSPYAASKAAAEIACGRAVRAEGQDIVVARPFQHIGPGQDNRFVIGSWTRQIAHLEADGGGVLEVGDLDVRRDVTDVRDVVRAYRLLLEPTVPAGTYNVASGRAVRLAEVAEILVGLARVRVTIRRDPARTRAVDIRVLAGDPSRLEEATGWQPEIPLERTLGDALAHARRLVRGDG